MKTPKGYRFSQKTLRILEKLKKNFPKWTETKIIETAIQLMNEIESNEEDENNEDT